VARLRDRSIRMFVTGVGKTATVASRLLFRSNR